ncbi:MAG: ATP-binding protein [Caldilineaceae bacterium]
MREFNEFGLVNPREHYHANRVGIKAVLHEKVEKGHYLFLTGARQTGKTTLCHELIEELEGTGEYFGILLDFQQLADFPNDRFYERLGQALCRWQSYRCPSAPQPDIMRHQVDFVRWLRATVLAMGRRGILIIDEFDAISVELVKALLSQFRAMYLERYEYVDVIHSILLVGVRNIPALLAGTQSPFNVADHFTVPYFTAAEIADLLQQHTAETGQAFAAAAIAMIYRETEGQPFLVNRLGQLLTREIVVDRSQPITGIDVESALVKLINENNTHFYSIRSKATIHRAELIPALFEPTRYYDFQDEVTQELLMYGVLRVVTDENGLDYARVANPIYRKMLIKAFAPSHTLIRQALNGSVQNRFVVNGALHFDALLDAFKAFMEEQGVRLLKSEITSRPLEISGQYLLLSYLTAALQSVGGFVTIESLSSAGEMDILAFYRNQRFLVETKVWYGEARFDQGKAQLMDYLQATGLPKGWLVVFDEKSADNPLLAQGPAIFEVTEADKVLQVYLVGIAV